MGNVSGVGTAHTVGKTLRAWAATQPDAPALMTAGRPTLSYRMLAKRIDEIRSRLNFLGLGRGDRVAIVLPTGDNLVVALLGVMDAATAAPLPPTCSRAEYHHLFEDLRIGALLTTVDPTAPARLAAEERNIPVVEIIPEPGEPAGGFEMYGTRSADAERPGRSKPGDTAVLLRTAGTMAEAKTVPVSQFCLIGRAVRKADALGIDASDRSLAFAPLYHAQGLSTAMLASLSVGGSVVILPGFTPWGFFDALSAFRPTWYTAVPPIQRTIIRNLPPGRPDFGELRFIHFGAAHAAPAIRLAVERTFGVPAIETYDTIETGTIAAEPIEPIARRSGTLGRIVAPDLVAVIDENGTIVAPGRVGEIVVRGPTVFAGYEGSSRPLKAGSDDGWFRTGDLGSIDSDGFLTLQGRREDIVERGSARVALSDIDIAFEQHPAVAEAIGFILPGPEGGEEVAAAVVLEEGASVSALALRRFVRPRLSEIDAPHRIEFVTEIPVTSHGKPIRNGLGLMLGLIDLDTAANDPGGLRRAPDLAEVAATLNRVLRPSGS